MKIYEFNYLRHYALIAAKTVKDAKLYYKIHSAINYDIKDICAVEVSKEYAISELIKFSTSNEQTENYMKLLEQQLQMNITFAVILQSDLDAM